jgi:hypothetical protein
MPDDPLPQLTAEDVRDMTPDEIVEARKAGQLNEHLGVPLPEPPFTQPVGDDGKPRAITEADLKEMPPELVVTLRRQGKLRHLGVA